MLDGEAHEGARAVEVVARLVQVHAALDRRLWGLGGSGREAGLGEVVRDGGDRVVLVLAAVVGGDEVWTFADEVLDAAR